MECDQVRDDLPAYDEETFSSAVMQHLEDCDDCRSFMQQYREIGAELSALAGYDVMPPAWLESAVTEAVLERLHRTAALRAASRQLGEHRGFAAGSALLLAGVAGAILVKGRHRRKVELAPPTAAA